MIIDCISDLHGAYPKLEGGDLLIVAGDLTARDEVQEYQQFTSWLAKQEYKKKIFIAGNHDNELVGKTVITFGDCEYLCDSGTEYYGLKIYGSPWTRQFEGMNPKCMAFTKKTENQLHKKFDIIPEDTDILITHSPPFTIHDMTNRREQVGSTALMCNILSRVKPKLHVFGHIHEGYGMQMYWDRTMFVNASHMTRSYEPKNPPIRIIL